jgi:membrane protein DedA with SNARE-associated domain
MADLLAHYGLALIFVNVLVEQIGVPVPALPTLLVAGAMAADGHLSATTAFVVAFTAARIADWSWYVAGRRYGPRIIGILGRISLLPEGCLRKSEAHFQRWGRFALVFAKFVPGISMLMPPLAGAMGVSWSAYLAFGSLGSAIWAGTAIGAGVLFHAEIDRLLAVMNGLGPIAFAALGVLLAGYVTTKWWQRHGFRKHWSSGYADVVQTLRHPAWRERGPGDGSVRVFDLVERDYKRGASAKGTGHAH